MRTLITTLVLVGTLGVVQTASAADKIDSMYTSLNEPECEVLEHNESEGEFYKARCPGVGGYALDFLEGDLRQSLNVIDPSGNEYQLKFWNVSAAFSALGKLAEWRVIKVNGKARPIALIVRFNASEDPEHSEKVTSYLVVSKITDSEICVTDVVKPIPNANEQARALADAAAGKACKFTEQ